MAPLSGAFYVSGGSAREGQSGLSIRASTILRYLALAGTDGIHDTFCVEFGRPWAFFLARLLRKPPVDGVICFGLGSIQTLIVPGLAKHSATQQIPRGQIISIQRPTVLLMGHLSSGIKGKTRFHVTVYYNVKNAYDGPQNQRYGGLPLIRPQECSHTFDLSNFKQTSFRQVSGSH